MIYRIIQNNLFSLLAFIKLRAFKGEKSNLIQPELLKKPFKSLKLIHKYRKLIQGNTTR